MSQKHPNLFFILCIGISLFLGWWIFLQWSRTASAQDSVVWAEVFYPHSKQDVEILQQQRRVKAEPRTVKGIYLTAYTAGSTDRMKPIIGLLDSTELNAVVIDIKDYSGKVLYDSSVPLVQEIGAAVNQIGDIKKLLQTLHEHDIYVIARQTVFQDPILAKVKQEWAIKNTSGGIWRDNMGLSWVDPTREEVWNYNIGIAKEAIRLGFDEINFDYVRFPSDGDLSTVVYTNGEKTKNEIMGEFYHYLNTQLADEPAWISLDMFGYVMERHDGMYIGQRLEDSAGEVDYVCPMMYPSHYPSGHLGLENPAEYPALVLENGLKKGSPYFVETRAKVRPWIQAFHLGAYYDDAKIRAQIDTVEKYSDAGWLMWNAANRYTSAGLLPEQHLENS